MTVREFRASLDTGSPPDGISPLLKALWHDAKGDWNKAHTITQDEDGADAAWVHAYLHRKEGDSGNASYWYSRAARPFSQKSLDEEWEEIVTRFLNDKGQQRPY